MSISSAQKLLPWLRWNAGGRKTPFSGSLVQEVELDTTTQCSGLPSCREQCTYAHSRNRGDYLRLELADEILDQLFSLGLRTVVFSGGGEPLEPENVGFSEILQLASSKGFEAELLTNGMFLTPDRLPAILPHLRLLRFSIPPFLKGYSHLKALFDRIKGAIEYRNQQGLEMVIMASLLIRPDTPEEEVQEDVRVLVGLGVDKIRFKPTHTWETGENLHLKVRAYQQIIDFIGALDHPQVTVSKIDRLLKVEDVDSLSCYYADFNPFVIGADGLNYACCEHKYHGEYQRGDLNAQSAEEILSFTGQNPQLILPGCFMGCKGDLANRYLHLLVQGYASLGEDMFSQVPYQELADAALLSLVRSHPRN